MPESRRLNQPLLFDADGEYVRSSKQHAQHTQHQGKRARQRRHNAAVHWRHVRVGDAVDGSMVARAALPSLNEIG
jgi:hypothetical protein